MNRTFRNLAIYACFLLSFLVLPRAARAQTGTVSGSVVTPDENGVQGVVVGALVELCIPSDTLRLSTSYTGTFYFRKVPVGTYTLRVSHLSYETSEQQVEVKEGSESGVDVLLKERTEHIRDVVVEAQVPLLTVRGDTLIFNAAATRIQEGDEAIRIVEQLPGAIVSEQGVTLLGQQISRTYVDGRLIFGRDPMAALRNLLANDVVKIRAYDEYADRRSGRKHRKGEKMERVLDIETRSKLISATTGHFLASYGADMQGHRAEGSDRYGIGGTANFFSEKLLLEANAFSNNIGRKSNRIADILQLASPKSSYDRNTLVDVGLTRTWGEWGAGTVSELAASYTYDDSYSRAANYLQQHYFPTEEYARREYADTTQNTTEGRRHEAFVSWSRSGEKSRLDIAHQMMFQKTGDRTRRSTDNILDDQPSAGSQSRNDRSQSYYHINESVAWIPELTERIGLGFSARVDLQNGDGSGLRSDSLASSSRRQVLTSSSVGRSQHVQAEASVSFSFSEEVNNGLDISYAYEYNNQHNRQTSLDPFDQRIDTVNTYNYTNRSQIHKEELQFRFFLPKLGDLRFGTRMQSAQVLCDERFPGPDGYDSWFHSLLPFFNFSKFSMMGQIYFDYTTYTQLPSVEQLRDRLDNTNPMMLIAGNPDLKPEYRHMFQFSYSRLIGKKNHSLDASIHFTLTDRQIVRRQEFFTSPTRLEAWDYVAPAQSTLTTYENVGGAKSGSAQLSWMIPSSKLHGQLLLQAIFNYEDLPSYVGSQLVRTRGCRPQLKFLLTSRPARNLQLSFSNTTGYNSYANNLNQKDRFLRESVSASGKWNNIFKYFYLQANYSFVWSHALERSGADVQNQILNVGIGCQFLKRRAEISFTAYDILNRNSGYTTAMYSDYVQESWVHSFGRYFTFNFAYKFNKSKSGISRSGLNTGAVQEKGSTLIGR